MPSRVLGRAYFSTVSLIRSWTRASGAAGASVQAERMLRLTIPLALAAQDSPWQAAKELAKAAEAARQAGDWPDVAPLWRAAALAYATASRHPAAADALAKGALALEQHDPKVTGLGHV